MINEIKALMAKTWEIHPDTIPDNAALHEFERWDSLAHVSLLLALEDKYGVEVNAETVHSLRSTEAILAALENRSVSPSA